MTNRIIKFRAWDKLYKQMTDIEWIDFIAETIGNQPNGITDSKDLDDVILMQFTGLTDKNGKEIYEGDIVGDFEGRMGEVKWGVFEHMDGEYYPNEYGWYVQYKMKRVSDDTMQSNLHSELPVEVIGNIYENFELLS